MNEVKTKKEVEVTTATPTKKESKLFSIDKKKLCPNSECPENHRIGINPVIKDKESIVREVYYCYGCQSSFS